jgi:thioredoxin-related protein
MHWRGLLASIVLFSCAAAEQPVETAHMEVAVYEDALEIAAEQGRRIYLVFRSEGCVWCGRQEEEMLKPKSIEAMDGLIVCAVDFEERRDLADRFGVRLLPSHRLLNSEGKTIRSFSGFMDSNGIARFLSR